MLLVSVDGKPGLGPLLGGEPLTGDEQLLRLIDGSGGRVRGRTITPKQAFGDYLELKGFGSLLRRAASAASFDVIAGSTPGMEHLLVLGKIKELDRAKAADLIIVDVPPAGHAAPFLRSATALRAAGRRRTGARPGQRGLCDARGPLPQPVRARHPAGGDTGQRGHRTGRRPARRHRPRAGAAGGERVLGRLARRTDVGRGGSEAAGRHAARGDASGARRGGRVRAASASTRRPSSSPVSMPSCRCRVCTCPGCRSPGCSPSTSTCWPTSLAVEPMVPEGAGS